MFSIAGLRNAERVVAGLFSQCVIGEVEEVCPAFFADNRELWSCVISKVVKVELAVRGSVGSFSKFHYSEFGVFTDRARVTSGPVWIFGALSGADLIFGHLFDEINHCIEVEVTIDIVGISGWGRRLAGRNIDSSVGGYLSVFQCDDDGRHGGILLFQGAVGRAVLPEWCVLN